MFLTNAQIPRLTVCSEDYNQQVFGLPSSTLPALPLSSPYYSGQILNNGPEDSSFGDPLSPSWFRDLDFPSAFELPCENSNSDASRLLVMPDQPNPSYTEKIQPQLSQRTRSVQQGSLTAKMIFSKLANYTQMMGEGKTLPPFIHPPCCVGQSDECAPESPHRCLPEILAVCANLTNMVYARVPGSHKYVWQQICTHLRKLRAEVSLDRYSLACYSPSAEPFISLRRMTNKQCCKLCRQRLCTAYYVLSTRIMFRAMMLPGWFQISKFVAFTKTLQLYQDC
jgi:hypothetical protein